MANTLQDQPNWIVLIVVFAVLLLFINSFSSPTDQDKKTVDQGQPNAAADSAYVRKDQPKTDILVVLNEPIRISVAAKNRVVVEDIYAASVTYSNDSTMITVIPSQTAFGEKLVIPLSEVQYIRYGN